MPVQITIRNVPDAVRNELASRASRQGQSLQQFLLAELEHLASLPARANWLDAVRSRKAATGTRISVASILQARDADRK